MHQADEDVLQRALAGLQVLEVDAVLGQVLEQLGDAGVLVLGVESEHQGMTIVDVTTREADLEDVFVSVMQGRGTGSSGDASR